MRSVDMLLSVFKEKRNWDSYFAESLKGKGPEHQNRFWWDLLNEDVCQLALNYLSLENSIRILEPGCGSAQTSFYLSEKIEVDGLYLTDISTKALHFSRSKEPAKLRDKVHYIEGDLFQMEWDIQFDLVWNIGLIEHYTEEEIGKIVSKMYKYTKPGGILILGMPNRRSLPVLKAAFLGSRFGNSLFKWVRGYRNDTEILYSIKQIREIIEKTTQEKVDVHYAGSNLWVGCPASLVKLFHLTLKQNRFCFLALFFVKKPLTPNLD